MFFDMLLSSENFFLEGWRFLVIEVAVSVIIYLVKGKKKKKQVWKLGNAM